MRKRIAFIMAAACILLIAGCGVSNSAEGVADYPAAIMVNDPIYLLEGNPMPIEVDESAIIGYTESYTGTFRRITEKLILILNWECHMRKWRVE